MKHTDYKIYDWIVVANAFNRQIKIYKPRYFERYPDGNYLKEIYNNNLPSAMERLFVMYFINNDIDRNDNDVQILINAYKQLQTVGHIG